jgi:hypothetical protein
LPRPFPFGASPGWHFVVVVDGDDDEGGDGGGATW